MDEAPNMRRAARDSRFKYIRNEIEGAPYFQPLAFRDSQPTMKELWAGLAAGTLPEAAKSLFDPLPRHQLFDTDSDPHEIKNLADEPAFQDVLARLQGELDAWIARVGDMSQTPEAEMILQMWPGGEQPATAPPTATIMKGSRAQQVVLQSATPGASIGYQIGADSTHWQLYSAPLNVPAGSVLRAKAIRYGYGESSVIEIDAGN